MDWDYIEKYYTHRNMEKPDELEAFLFFLSEVGELADAYLKRGTLWDMDKQTSTQIFNLLGEFVEHGYEADILVSRMNDWTRNGDRKKEPCINDEIGDCQMMLSVFAHQRNTDSWDCMKEKFEKKGFRYE